MTAPFEPFDSEERSLADLIAEAPLPASLAAGLPLRAPRRGGVRLRPLALALLVPVVVAAIAGGIGLHARFAATPVAPAGGHGAAPPPRGEAMMAWDAAHHDVVLFGGYGLNGALGDTWTWDGSGWTEMHPTDAPPATSGGAMAFDANRRLIVLVARDDQGHGTWTTWTWDGSDWHHESDGDLAVDAVMQAGLAFDQARHQLVLAAEPVPNESSMAGDGPRNKTTLATYVWSGSHWALRQATGPQMLMGSFGMAWDPATHHVVVLQAAEAPIGVCGAMRVPPGMPTAPPDMVTCHGNAASVRCTSVTCPPAHQWGWDGSRWLPGPGDEPYFGQVYDGTLATSPFQIGLALASGRTVWTWNARSWISQTLDEGPPVDLVGEAVAADPDQNQVVVFGGRTYDGSATPPRSQIGNQTWTWNGRAWTARGGAMFALPARSAPQHPPVVTPGCSVSAWRGPTVTSQQLRNGVLEIQIEVGPTAVGSNGTDLCATGRSFDVEIDGDGSRPLAITGNPTRVKTAMAVITLEWANWCGGTQGAVLSLRPVTGGGPTGITGLPQAPPCTQRGQPSTLDVQQGPR